MHLAYVCKFCRRPGIVEAPKESIPALTMMDMEKWLPILACDRCADYHSARITLRDRITKVAVTLIRARQSREETSELMLFVRKAFGDLTQQFAGLVCRYHKRHEVWEPEFIQLLVEKPDRTHEILRNFERQIAA